MKLALMSSITQPTSDLTTSFILYPYVVGQHFFFVRPSGTCGLGCNFSDVVEEVFIVDQQASRNGDVTITFSNFFLIGP
jgi:hypothetical protein